MSYENIRIALDTQMASITGIPTVVFDNTSYTQSTDTPFVKASLVPVSRRPIVVGYNPHQEYKGLYSILICVPQNQGTGSIYTYADLIASAFNATTDLSYGGEYVLVDYSEVGTPHYDSPFYCLPVTVGWHSFK
jgi:hypothetical protein